ncbi:hypothetical protein FACS1894125_6170 [Actinomycetota bacterium]|nr:hypothetical protein FACS1894125_6170 [Actinomycetota bacterium]
MINLKNVSKTYNGVDYKLRDINLEVEKGEVVAIIGPAGSGKSLLLKSINMLEPPTAGEIVFDGVNLMDKSINLDGVRKRMGMVFQNFTLFENLNVLQNLTIGPEKLLGMPKVEAQEQALKILKQIGLLSKAKSYSEDLSDGQKQRVAIARSLSMNPEILLFDEPTSNLDPTAVGEVVQVMQTLAKAGTTMVIVTHRLSIVKDIATRVVFMSDGSIVESGDVDAVLNNPKERLTRDFVFQTKSFSFDIDTPDYDFIALINDVENYSIQNGITEEAKEKLRHIVEELGGLVPKTSGSKIEVYTDSSTNKLTILATYGGFENNLLANDSMEKKIIEKMSKSVDYYHKDGINQIKVVV